MQVCLHPSTGSEDNTWKRIYDDGIRTKTIYPPTFGLRGHNSKIPNQFMNRFDKFMGATMYSYATEYLLQTRGGNISFQSGEGIDTIKYHTCPEKPYGKVTKHIKIQYTREPKGQPFPSW